MVKRVRIVIVGGSFGGLTAAYRLRRLLEPSTCEVTLIAKDRRFVFIPALPWVAVGATSVQKISFDLEQALARRKIGFEVATAQRIDPVAQTVTTDHGEHRYDYLVVATGHRSANEAVPGLGPFEGPGHSLMSPPEAEEAGLAWGRFLDDPGPMVVGCAPGASCIGPAYEFAFEVDGILRRRRQRHRVPITFVTPEPFLGHFGVGGMGGTRLLLEDALEARDIRYLTSAAVAKIGDSSVELADGRIFDSRYSMIIPPLAGVKAVADSPGLANPRGFIPVNEHYRHEHFPNIYAVGVAVAFPPVETTPVPVNFPKTGHMTEQMAIIAAHNLAVDVRGGKKRSSDLAGRCILAMGARAVYMKANPIRPPRNVSEMSAGRRWLWAKTVFTHYYLWAAKHGHAGTGAWGF